MLWKVKSKKTVRIPETTFKQEEKLEKHLEEWIKSDPEILEETLLIVGQQVQVADFYDTLDLLGIDPEGKSVIIEVKRGKVKDPLDIQCLKYASYISGWTHGSFETQSDKFYSNPENCKLLKELLGEDAEYTNLNQILDDFCEEEYQLNQDQRIVIAGMGIDDKTTSVLLWLRNKGVDAKFVDLRVVKDGRDRFITPRTLIPQPTFDLFGREAAQKDESWKIDGRAWHLEKRCSKESGHLLEDIVTVLEDLDLVDEISWEQKYYVAVRAGNKNWAIINTRASLHNLRIYTRQGKFKEKSLAKRLGLSPDDVTIKPKRRWDRIEVKYRVGETLDEDALRGWAAEAVGYYLS